MTDSADAISCEPGREQIIDRYARIGRLGGWHRARSQLKRAIFNAAVAGTLLVKRLLDIVASIFLLIALLPFFALVALLIRLDSSGPILFSQVRVGRWGKTFAIWKFRSMYTDAEERKAALEKEQVVYAHHAQAQRFKMKKDPRITRVGRFIRKGSIDELPQLWNVLRGDMSLVGPRPPVPREVAKYTLADRRRLEVIPGITYIWQVSGRSDIPFDQQVELDVDYIESHSLRMDLHLLLKTIPAVFMGKGAY